MARSNSKLSAEQKQELKIFKEDYDGEFEFIQSESWGFTLLLIKGDLDYKVSASYQSYDELKFRKKVGQYWALDRMMYHNNGSRCINQYIFDTYYRNNNAAIAKLARRLVFKR